MYQLNKLATKVFLDGLFVSHEEIESTTNVNYSEEHKLTFSKTLPSMKILLQLRDNGCLLCAGTPHPMSLKDIHLLNAGLIYLESWQQYFIEDELIQKELVGTKWLILKRPIESSTYCPDCDHTRVRWSKFKQFILLNEPNLILAQNAAQVTWCMSLYMKIAGKYFSRRKDDLINTTSFLSTGGNNLSITTSDAKTHMVKFGCCGGP